MPLQYLVASLRQTRGRTTMGPLAWGAVWHLVTHHVAHTHLAPGLNKKKNLS